MDKRTLVKVSNTCAVKSVIAVIANGYIESEDFRNFVETENNNLFQQQKPWPQQVLQLKHTRNEQKLSALSLM